MDIFRDQDNGFRGRMVFGGMRGRRSLGEQESGHSGQEGSLDKKIMSSHIYSGQLDNILEIKITDTIADKRSGMKENDEWKDSDARDWTASEY